MTCAYCKTERAGRHDRDCPIKENVDRLRHHATGRLVRSMAYLHKDGKVSENDLMLFNVFALEELKDG